MTQTNHIENERENHVHNLLCLLRCVCGLKEALFYKDCIIESGAIALESNANFAETLERFVQELQDEYPHYFMCAGIKEPEGITEDDEVFDECIKEVETLFFKLPLLGSKPGKWEWVPYE